MDLTGLVAKLTAAGPHAEQLAGAALAKTAMDIVARAQSIVPVDTGYLRSSIGADIDRAALTADVGPTAHYGGYVENGTSRMAPRPYIGPAFDAIAPKLEQVLARIDPLS